MTAAAFLAAAGIGLTLCGAWIMRDARSSAAFGAVGALIAFAGVVCLVAAPLALF